MAASVRCRCGWWRARHRRSPTCAVYVARLVAEQEADHVADLARLADAVERGDLAELLHARGDVVEHLLEHADQQRCLDHTGHHAVHPHALLRDFGGRRARQADRAVLGGVVGAGAREAALGADRGGVDHRTLAGGDHVREHEAQAEEHAAQVHVQHLVEHGDVVFVGRGEIAFDAGVVEEPVDPAESIHRGADVALRPGPRRHNRNRTR